MNHEVCVCVNMLQYIMAPYNVGRQSSTSQLSQYTLSSTAGNQDNHPIMYLRTYRVKEGSRQVTYGSGSTGIDVRETPSSPVGI